MTIPYMANALKGWTKVVTVTIITKSIVDGLVNESSASVPLDINFQPTPPEKVNRKPEAQRSWKWWSILLKKPPFLLKIDDKIQLNGETYRVEVASDWLEAGFQACDCVEDFT